MISSSFDRWLVYNNKTKTLIWISQADTEKQQQQQKGSVNANIKRVYLCIRLQCLYHDLNKLNQSWNIEINNL